MRCAVPLQETVIDLLVGDDVAQAVDVLLIQSIPAQDDVLLLLGEMLCYQQEAQGASSGAPWRFSPTSSSATPSCGSLPCT